MSRAAAERGVLVPALLTVIAVRIALWLLPARSVARAAVRLQRRQHATSTGGSTGGSPTTERIAWAVRVVSARIPRATCLTQALATQILLGRAGRTSRLTHGVARDVHGAFCAHAWVEVDGRVVIGGDGLERYARLPDLTTVP